ncbi:MAG: hypothetical protein K2Y09_01595 [Nitrosomonas sp.]|uniref:hypothetical protein n=1 Tax=Nitrosomonas sp. TaxID=42353 RepID=UPI001D61A6F4|nr:hypothetical protein [Nitrosomonas sp.]MBX9893864.1 hypothetical protein [Nitrosomonas sp.]
MSSPAIPDLVTVVGSAYFQPIADLVESLTRRDAPNLYASGTSQRENGYAASISVLLVAVLESYTARLRFVRNSEFAAAAMNTPDLLEKYFPDLPNKSELVEVFLLRNLLLHNHIWHLDVSDVEAQGAPTLATPKELGFHTNKHYEDVVDVSRRKTKTLELNAMPTSVDRGDAQKVFRVVWNTLSFMGAKNYSHTPLAGRTVRYEGKFRQFEELIEELDRTASPDAG